MVARELRDRKTHPAIHADLPVAPEQRLVVEGRRVVAAQVARIVRVPDGRDDRAHRHTSAPAAARVRAAVKSIKKASNRVRDLFHVIEARRFAIVDPLQRHAGHVRAQHLLGQGAMGRGYDERALIVPLVDRNFGFELAHNRGRPACKIRQDCAIIQRRKPFKVKDKIWLPWLRGHRRAMFPLEATCQW